MGSVQKNIRLHPPLAFSCVERSGWWCDSFSGSTDPPVTWNQGPHATRWRAGAVAEDGDAFGKALRRRSAPVVGAGAPPAESLFGPEPLAFDPLGGQASGTTCARRRRRPRITTSLFAAPVRSRRDPRVALHRLPEARRAGRVGKPNSTTWLRRYSGAALAQARSASRWVNADSEIFTRAPTQGARSIGP
jgi:hypothetical protein